MHGHIIQVQVQLKILETLVQQQDFIHQENMKVTHMKELLKSNGTDDDILGVIIGYVIEDGKHYTLSAVRQTTGNIVQTGLQWGLVYNINQDHTDNTRDQALLKWNKHCRWRNPTLECIRKRNKGTCA